MAITVFPLDATSGAPAYSAQQTRQVMSALMGPTPSTRPLGAYSGVRPGTPSNKVYLSPAFTWNVGVHSGVLDVQSSTTAAPYLYATDGSDTGTVTAADATNPRVDIVYVQVNDNVQDSTGLESGTVGYLAGTPAATPAAPATPARSMVLAQINVPKSGGGNPTVSWVAPTYGAVAYGSYNPQWTATTTNPSLGNGSISGRWQQTNQTIDATIVLTGGSTTNWGSGTYFFTLPTAVTSAINVASFPLGIGVATPAGATQPGVVNLVSSTTVRLSRGSDGSSIGSTSGTWASGNTIAITVRYEAA